MNTATSTEKMLLAWSQQPDSLDAGVFPSVVLAVALAVTMDEASSLSGLLCSHSHGESIASSLSKAMSVLNTILPLPLHTLYVVLHSGIAEGGRGRG